MFVLVGRVLIKHSKKNANRAKEEKNMKARVSAGLKTLISLISVMLMFGLTWLFGALSVSGAAIVFQWLFIIAATSQGFLLFIFFCVIGKDARQEWKQLLTCYRYKPRKQGATPSGVSSGTKTRSYNTRETHLTSRNMASNTIRRSVGLLEKSEPVSTFDSSVAPLEMSDISPTKIDLADPVIEEDTSLVISNGHLNELEKPKTPDSQLPPQVLFRLKRCHYDLIVEEESAPSPTSSPELSSTAVEDIDSHHSSSEDSETNSDNELTEL